MPKQIDVVFAWITVGCWVPYLLLFRRPITGRRETARRDRTSLSGVALQFSAVALVWFWRRSWLSPLTGESLVDSLLYALSAAMAVGAVVLSRQALRVLGHHWNFVAGTGDQHRLVVEGPYARLRHPLYTAFFGLTLSTGLVWSDARAVPVALMLFVLGVWIRVRAEERLLREFFGDEFRRYARSVPAFFFRW